MRGRIAVVASLHADGALLAPREAPRPRPSSPRTSEINREPGADARGSGLGRHARSANGARRRKRSRRGALAERGRLTSGAGGRRGGAADNFISGQSAAERGRDTDHGHRGRARVHRARHHGDGEKWCRVSRGEHGLRPSAPSKVVQSAPAPWRLGRRASGAAGGRERKGGRGGGKGAKRGGSMGRRGGAGEARVEKAGLGGGGYGQRHGRRREEGHITPERGGGRGAR